KGTDESLDGALLIAAARRAHLDTDADVDDGLRERGVPRLDVAALAALLHDRLRPIEDCEERQPAECDEVPREAADDGLGALVVDERHRDEAGELEARGEEVHALRAPVDKADVDVAEVVLREFA